MDSDIQADELTRRKIIYVDDVYFALVSIKDRLKEKYDIYPAQSTEKMYEILEKVQPDLILLDLQMPEVDGFETIKQLKANPLYNHIPIIFLTGGKSRKSVIKGMELGAVDVLFKPVTDEMLIECVEYQFDPIMRKDNCPVILAVDDSPSILKSINQALQDIYRVYTLPRPEALKDILEKLTPDLFLLDCQMPVLSGFELIPIIRETPGFEDTPIVFLTSEGTNDNVFAAMGLGASGFIVKPIEDEVLRLKLAAHLEGYILRRRLRLL